MVEVFIDPGIGGCMVWRTPHGSATEATAVLLAMAWVYRGLATKPSKSCLFFEIFTVQDLGENSSNQLKNAQ